MKRILAMLLCAATFLGCFTFTSFAAEKDQIMVFDDLQMGEDNGTGLLGYCPMKDAFTESDAGYTIAFDFLPINFTDCMHSDFSNKEYSHVSQFTFTTGSNADGKYSVFGYNFETEQWVFTEMGGWFPEGHSQVEGGSKQNYFVKYAYDMPFVPGEWHRVAFRIEDVYLQMWIDGVQIGEELVLQSVGHQFAMFWSQHCRYAIDNLVLATNKYNLAEEDLDAAIAEGIVYKHTDFNNGYDDVADFPFGDGTYKKISEDEETGEEIVTYNPHYLADRDTYAGCLSESSDANALSFSDVESEYQQQFTTKLTYNGGDAIDAKKLYLSYDKQMKFIGVDKVADGCTVTVSGNNVDVKVPAGFKGTVAEFTFEMLGLEDEYLPAQYDTYRYGFMYLDGVSSGEVVLDAGAAFNVNYIRGDADNNGVVNILDAIAIMQRILKNPDYMAGGKFAINELAANVYKDSVINSKDCLYIAHYCVKNPEYPL